MKKSSVELKEGAGQMIKIYMIKEGYKNKHFAEEIGIPRQYLSNILNYNQTPSKKVAEQIVDNIDKYELEDLFLIKKG